MSFTAANCIFHDIIFIILSAFLSFFQHVSGCRIWFNVWRYDLDNYYDFDSQKLFQIDRNEPNFFQIQQSEMLSLAGIFIEIITAVIDNGFFMNFLRNNWLLETRSKPFLFESNGQIFQLFFFFIVFTVKLLRVDWRIDEMIIHSLWQSHMTLIKWLNAFTKWLNLMNITIFHMNFIWMSIFVVIVSYLHVTKHEGGNFIRLFQCYK